MKSFMNQGWNQLFVFLLIISSLYMLTHASYYKDLFFSDNKQQIMSSQSAATTSPQSQAGSRTITNDDKLLSDKTIDNMNHAIAVANEKIKVSGSGFTKKILPKKKGEWLVDIKKSADSDSDNLDEVLLNASWDDVIRIKDGTYSTNLKISNKVTLIGENRNQVIIKNNGAENNDLAAFENTKIEVKLANLTLEYSGNQFDRFMYFSDSYLVMDNVTIQAPFARLDSLLLVDNMRQFSLNSVSVTGSKASVGIEIHRNKKNIDYNFENCDFQNLKTGIYSHSSNLNLKKINIANVEIGIKFVNNGTLNATGLNCLKCETGISVTGLRSHVKLFHSTFTENHNAIDFKENLFELNYIRIEKSKVGIISLNSIGKIDNTRIESPEEYGFIVSSQSVIDAHGVLIYYAGKKPWLIDKRSQVKGSRNIPAI